MKEISCLIRIYFLHKLLFFYNYRTNDEKENSSITHSLVHCQYLPSCIILPVCALSLRIDEPQKVRSFIFLSDLLQRTIDILHFYSAHCSHSCGIVDYSRIRIDGKHIFPSATKLYIQTCVYYRIVADGGLCEKRRQHRYDIGGLYL